MRFRVDVAENARIALSSLRSNRMRTVLTTVGIGIGVATLLAIVGIIQGLNASFEKQLSSLGTNSVYVSKYPWIIMGDWWMYRNRQDLTLDHMEKLRAVTPLATAVVPTVSQRAEVAADGQQLSSVTITGSTDGYLEVAGNSLVSGRFLTVSDDSTAQRVAVIGDDVAKGIFPGLDPVGQSLRINGLSHRVIGTLARQGKLLDQSRDLVVLIPYSTFRGIFGHRRSLSIGVAVADPAQLPALEDQLEGSLRRLRKTPPGADNDFTFNKPEQFAKTYQQLTSALYAVAVGIGLITLLVGGIGIMNIMLVSVRERTREIGIRRALGARKRTIVLQFLFEAASVSALGGTLGALVGLGTVRVVAEISPLAAVVRPETILGGILFSALVGLIFGIWPAARAANLDPVEALRYE